MSNAIPGVRSALEAWGQGTAGLFIVRRTHRADFQLVALERLQPHQGPDASADQDFVTDVVFQEVCKLLGIACTFVGKKAEFIPTLVTGLVREGPEEEMPVVVPEMENSLPG